jgi:AraC-like DNA-binding protein
VINELTIFSIFVYVSIAAIFLWRTQKRNSDKKKASLYKMLWVDIGFMTFLVALIIFVKAHYEHDLGDYIIITAICIFIYSVSIKIIRDSVFFKGEQSTKKYSKSTIDENLKEAILNKINETMEDKYYLNVNPSLPDLAKKINTSPNYVSQVINEKMNLTFLEMINKYRIEEAKKMILDLELNETIEGIAYLVGFNSKSTFHSAFKRFTKQTPSEFKNSKKA